MSHVSWLLRCTFITFNTANKKAWECFGLLVEEEALSFLGLKQVMDTPKTIDGCSLSFFGSLREKTHVLLY